MSANTRAALLGLLGFSVYAAHDVIVKFLGATYSPFQMLFFSVIFAFPLVSFMLVRDASVANLRPRHPWWTMLRVLTILISASSFFYAFSVLPLAQTYSILFSVPLMVTALAIPVLGEKVGLHRGAAILVGLIGVLIVVRPGTASLSLGHIAALTGSFCTALTSVIVRRIGRDERDVVLLLFPMLGMFVVMGSLMPFHYKPMPLVDLGAMALLSVLGFIAFNSLIAAYKSGEAVVVAPTQYSQIIWATVFGVLIFGEDPDTQTLLGAAVVIASGLYIVARESRKDTSENTPVLRTRSRGVTGVFSRIISGGNKDRDGAS